MIDVVAHRYLAAHAPDKAAVRRKLFVIIQRLSEKNIARRRPD
jgi:hypothetical protein